jgi:hypothetical protein
MDREATEQLASLRSLAASEGRTAAEAVTRLIIAGTLLDPGKWVPLEAAGVGCRLRPDRVAASLHDYDPKVWAHALN